MIRGVLLWGSRNRQLARAASRARFVKRAVRRFIPGEGREEALMAAETLGEDGFPTTFTLLGENVESAAGVRETVDEYLALLEEIHLRNLDAHISVKLTQLGLDQGEPMAQESLAKLVDAAEKAGSFVWIDMEDSSYKAATIRVFRETALSMGAHGVGLCLQAYLRDTPADVEALLPLEPYLRLVKGAYAELPEVAYPRKKDVDEAYFALAKTILSSPAHLAVATHDPRLVRRIHEWARSSHLPPDHLEFQMLFGIGARLRAELAAEKKAVRVLISYGPAWFPWYMRRLAERPANLGFVVRSMFRG